MFESKRIKKLRESIIKEIPKSPNNKETLQCLQSKHLADLLIIYANWQIRYVTPRPREIIIEPSALNHSRWIALSDEISGLLKKVKLGGDITPYLSLLIHKKGFSLATISTGADVDRWADKDFLLNVMGYHHFHLGNVQEGKNNADRTDYVLFAEVNRDKLIVVDIFDHTVFETNINASIAVTTERQRLWEIFNERISRKVPPGSVFAPSMIMTSGHSFHIVRRAQDYIRVMKEIDPQLDDYNYVRGLYEEAEIPMPQKYKLSWYLNYLDFGLLDNLSGNFFIFRYGVN